MASSVNPILVLPTGSRRNQPSHVTTLGSIGLKRLYWLQPAVKAIKWHRLLICSSSWRVREKKERSCPKSDTHRSPLVDMLNNGCLMYYISLKIVQMSGTKFLPEILSALVNHRLRQHSYQLELVKKWVTKSQTSFFENIAW